MSGGAVIGGASASGARTPHLVESRAGSKVRYDVGVADLAHELDLLAHGLRLRAVGDGYDLDRNHEARLAVHGLVHLAEGAFADLLLELKDLVRIADPCQILRHVRAVHHVVGQ